MNEVFGYAVWFVQLCLVVAIGNATLRLFIGPAAQDRVLAFDSMYTNGLLLVLVLGIRSRSTAYFDIALMVALFGFLGTLALGRFLLRGEVIEP